MDPASVVIPLLGKLLVILGLLVPLSFARSASAGEVALLPSSHGHLGAWLLLGPIPAGSKSNRTPHGLDTVVIAGGEEASLTGRLGRTVAITPPDADSDAPTTATWRVVGSVGALDVGAVLNHRGSEGYAFLYGTLHLTEPLKGLLLVGASDGARVWIDRRMVSTNDASRLERDDEDVIRLDLSAGEHSIVIKLHNRQAWWAVRTRIVDAAFAPPRGVSLRLPGTSDGDARSLLQKMTEITVDRGISPAGFRPTVSVSFPGGLPRGTDRFVHVGAAVRAGGKVSSLFGLDAGEVPLGASGPSELRVQLPPIAADEISDAENGGELGISVEVAGRKLDAPLALRPFMRKAMAAADQALSLATTPSTFLSDPAVTKATIEHLRDRFARHVNAGDTDLEALAADARTIVEFKTDLEAQKDPLRVHAGVRRFAYRSPLDDELAPFGMYVPESYAENPTANGKTYPLTVILHGLNGKPLSFLQVFFGHDREGRDVEWEDRHISSVEPVEGFVLAPNGHGNAMYRELGERDVVKLIDWAEGFFPIDKNRISISGASMGGTGAASIAFRYPDRFAAAEPLCGYHSYFIRGDVAGVRMWPWEKLLAEQRTNVLWAENGLYLPLYVWHGKRDYPEKNSGVLIDRYKALGYAIEHEHPMVGHDVWKKAYEGVGAFRWLSQKTRPEHKRRILFKTDSPRYADNAWVHLREISNDLEFATIDANIADPTDIDVTTRSVEAFALDRDSELVSSTAPTRVKIDGSTLVFEPNVPIAAYRVGDAWKSGLKSIAPGRKRAGLSGPMRDIFFEPLVFVYGTLDPLQTRANRDTARTWAKMRWGVDVRYPIIPDTELDDRLAENHSLVLVGNAESNLVVRDIEPRLPFKVTASSIVALNQAGNVLKEWKGKDLGVAFIYPNPRFPSRYVLVLEGTSPLGTFRSIALPELVPDFMVFDDRIAYARGQILLAGATPLAGGNFRPDWSFGRIEATR